MGKLLVVIEDLFLTTQRFKTVISKSGTRTFIAVPFNPNDVWGVKGRHHITGSVNGYGVRGSLGSDERSIFSLWALPGGAVAVLKPAQK